MLQHHLILTNTLRNFKKSLETLSRRHRKKDLHDDFNVKVVGNLHDDWPTCVGKYGIA